jgi:hypothetical protein
MSAGAYKPTHTHQATQQALKVWQLRLEATARALRAGAFEEARQRLEELIATLRPDAFPEFADNLLWLYRSALAHLEAGQPAGAIGILESLEGLLAGAARRLAETRSSRAPFSAQAPGASP